MAVGRYPVSAQHGQLGFILIFFRNVFSSFFMSLAF